MTSNNSLVLPLAVGEVGESNVVAGLAINGPAQQLQRLSDEETLSRLIPASNCRGSRPNTPLTSSGNRQVPIENVNEDRGRDLEPSRPPRQTRGGRTRARSSLGTRTSERQRLRMSQSSPPRESNVQATVLEQLSSSENVVTSNIVSNEQSVAPSRLLNQNTSSVHSDYVSPLHSGGWCVVITTSWRIRSRS